MVLAACLAWALVPAPPAFAHGGAVGGSNGAPPSFGWQFTPWVTALLCASLAAYAIGYVRLVRRGRLGRAVRHRRLAAFGSGWLVLAAVLVSPLDTLSAALFSAHMVQHEAMMIVSAPLLVLGCPLGTWIWALPPRARVCIGRAARSRGWTCVWRRLVSPAWAWMLHAVALWAWHAPVLFEAALARDDVHALQHASFLVTALLFWWTIVGNAATRSTGGHAMLSLFTTMVHTGALGALLTLAPGLWYPSYVEPAAVLGLDALRDQQLGGLIMWVPAALAYLLGALAVAARWLLPSATVRAPSPPRAHGGATPACPTRPVP
ncbi:cytochrome c oxidase assembly protein [Trinickia caryophylli]|nr:cytochrome c oxidase assembly protein [Trinickia caryophylli]PMS13850.1 cytochrome c oxidase assembly protein [Trinickia caryophylli]TRX15389.1 cytochrome c oxidase assembly protein [Trinickia caryophylli]WQE15728.1 cytochrome c oxidase assembly protein [Trinickia caryophylli]GLU33321.1 membrane protein [Trinickia caryophylli]